MPAHPRCNRAKLDFLAEQGHIESWRERNDDGRLALLAQEQSWERYSEGTLGVARAIYFGLPDGTPLWVEGDRFSESSHGVLRRVLS